MLGIREVLPAKKILEEIKTLKTNPSKNPRVTDFNIMLNMFKDLEEKSHIKSTIDIIQY
jgi:hypothetical protein